MADRVKVALVISGDDGWRASRPATEGQLAGRDASRPRQHWDQKTKALRVLCDAYLDRGGDFVGDPCTKCPIDAYRLLI
jgi:hypothetical protein